MTAAHLPDSTTALVAIQPCDVRLMFICGAVFCLVIAAELSAGFVRAVMRAIYPFAMSAFVAGAAFGLLTAMALGLV